jgi:hypothetical protein
MTFPTKIRTTVASLAFAAFTLTATASFAEEPKVAQTAAEHEAMAKQYKDQAAAYQKLADDHKVMAAAYGKPAPGAKGKDNWSPKMVKHCEQISKDASKLAADAEKAADFHMLRSKEVQGK